MRRYASWAGNPGGVREDITRCALQVHGPGRGMTFHQCSRPRGYGPGNLYCKQHAKEDPKSLEWRTPKDEAVSK